MWGNGGWRCIERTAPQRDWKPQISRIWEGEMEEVVRHYSWPLWSVGSAYVLHQTGLERYFRARGSPSYSFRRDSCCARPAGLCADLLGLRPFFPASVRSGEHVLCFFIIGCAERRCQPGLLKCGQVQTKRKRDVDAASAIPLFWQLFTKTHLILLSKMLNPSLGAAAVFPFCLFTRDPWDCPRSQLTGVRELALTISCRLVGKKGTQMRTHLQTCPLILIRCSLRTKPHIFPQRSHRRRYLQCCFSLSLIPWVS